MTISNTLRSCLFLAVVACGAQSDTGQAGTPEQTFSGIWKGKCAGEGVYLTLVQDGMSLTGTHCEKPDHDCYPLSNGLVSDGVLSFRYAFGAATVSAELRPDGPDRLVGTYLSSKSPGSFPAELSRVAQQ